MKKVIDMFKTCFTCKRTKPLFLFKLNKMKYQIKSNKGVVTECRVCSVKRLYKQDGYVVKYNFELKKFQVVYIKPSLTNLIKEYFY